MGLTIILTLLLAMIEIAARLFERQTAKRTRVASVDKTDHVIDGPGQALRIGAIGMSLAFMLALYGFGAPPLLGLTVVVIFALLRAGLALLDQQSARASQIDRLARALKHPDLAQVSLGMFFSAVDLMTPDHVKVWEAEIDAIDLPWLLLTPEPHHFAALQAAGRRNVICLPNLSSALYVLPPSLKVLLYANNAQKNRSVLKALPQITHVQILHGDSDKPSSYSPLTKNYDKVFVAGQMAIDRYARNGVFIPSERFCIVGRPQVVAIDSTREPATQALRPQIVYMPTWRGFFEDAQFSSLDRADQILETILSLPQAVDVLFKPHPLSYKDPDWPRFEKHITAALSAKRANGSTGQLSPPDLTPFDLYNRADLLICDISSVMIDFLYANKPFITVLPQGFSEAERPNFPSLAASYEVQAGLEDLQEQLVAGLGPDPMAATRADVRASAFGDLDQPPGAAFRAACRDLIGGPSGTKAGNCR